MNTPASMLITSLVNQSKVGRPDPCAQADWLVGKLCENIRATFAAYEPTRDKGLGYIEVTHKGLGCVECGFDYEPGQDGGSGPEREESFEASYTLCEVWVNGRNVAPFLADTTIREIQSAMEIQIGLQETDSFDDYDEDRASACREVCHYGC